MRTPNSCSRSLRPGRPEPAAGSIGRSVVPDVRGRDVGGSLLARIRGPRLTRAACAGTGANTAAGADRDRDRDRDCSDQAIADSVPARTADNADAFTALGGVPMMRLKARLKDASES